MGFIIYLISYRNFAGQSMGRKTVNTTWASLHMGFGAAFLVMLFNDWRRGDEVALVPLITGVYFVLTSIIMYYLDHRVRKGQLKRKTDKQINEENNK